MERKQRRVTKIVTDLKIVSLDEKDKEEIATKHVEQDFCPDCGEELLKVGKCSTCPACGWSKCDL